MGAEVGLQTSIRVLLGSPRIYSLTFVRESGEKLQISMGCLRINVFQFHDGQVGMADGEQDAPRAGCIFGHAAVKKWP